MIQRIHSILLVDDDAITNFINERLLKKLQITDHIKIAHNGDEALKYIEKLQHDGESLPDLIFLDINMPVVDGFEFLERYNKLTSLFNNKGVVVMLTTSTNPNDMDHLLYAGNADFLSKPLTQDKIVSIVNKHFMQTSYKMA